MNPFFLIAALADLTAVVVHGVVGHRIFVTPMTHERLFSTHEFGDADMSHRVLVVTWHAVTATFASSAVMMSLLAFGIVTNTSVSVFLSAMHASILVLGLFVAGPRVSALWKRPIPLGFVACMTTVVVMGWLGSR